MNTQMRKWMRVCAAGALVVLASCSPDNLLLVNNPNAIQLERLDDVALLNVQLAGVQDQFIGNYTGTLMQYSNYPTDEIITALNWEGHARVNVRVISWLEGPTAGMFEGPSRALRMGHDVAGRIRGWITEYPEKNLQDELALDLVITGYAAVTMAEVMCQAVVSPDPDDPSGTVLSQVETFGVALPYLEEALSVAQGAGETDIVNLARTGLARAHLGMGNWAQAATYASQVDPDFVWWMNFIDDSGGRNPFQGTSHGGNFTLGIHPNFTGVHPSFDGTGFSYMDDNVIAPQTDPRIQHWPTDLSGHNQSSRLYKLFQSLRYSDYTGETLAPPSAECPACTGTDPNDMELLSDYGTDIMLADYVEAQHHYYEALAMQGGNDAAVLAFVNARRAVGNQAPVTLAGQALKKELRNQRGRDLFMGGFRLADLRRWTRFDPGNGPFAGGSYFPTGNHVNDLFGPYGEWTCFPIPSSEYEGNPNLSPPANPDIPPGI